jgi:hypothetical protein
MEQVGCGAALYTRSAYQWLTNYWPMIDQWLTNDWQWLTNDWQNCSPLIDQWLSNEWPMIGNRDCFNITLFSIIIVSILNYFDFTWARGVTAHISVCMWLGVARQRLATAYQIELPHYLIVIVLNITFYCGALWLMNCFNITLPMLEWSIIDQLTNDLPMIINDWLIIGNMEWLVNEWPWLANDWQIVSIFHFIAVPFGGWIGSILHFCSCTWMNPRCWCTLYLYLAVAWLG